MAEGHGRDAWTRAAALMAVTHNSHCSRKRDLKKASDFNPYAEKRVADKQDLALIKDALEHGRRKAAKKPQG